MAAAAAAGTHVAGRDWVVCRQKGRWTMLLAKRVHLTTTMIQHCHQEVVLCGLKDTLGFVDIVFAVVAVEEGIVEHSCQMLKRTGVVRSLVEVVLVGGPRQT